MAGNAMSVFQPDAAKNIVLAPMAPVAGRLDEMHVVRWTPIKLDIDRETYNTQNGRGLHKSIINRIMTAAGIRVVSSLPLVREPDYLLWQVKVAMDVPNAEPITGIGTKEWQFGIGKDGNDREHRVGKTETKALLRAVRELLGIQSSYDPQMLQRAAAEGFAVPRIDYAPDYSNPEVVKALRAAQPADVATLYGPQDEDAPEGVDPETGEIIDGTCAEESDGDVLDGQPVDEDWERAANWRIPSGAAADVANKTLREAWALRPDWFDMVDDNARGFELAGKAIRPDQVDLVRNVRIFKAGMEVSK